MFPCATFSGFRRSCDSVLREPFELRGLLFEVADPPSPVGDVVDDEAVAVAVLLAGKWGDRHVVDAGLAVTVGRK